MATQLTFNKNSKEHWETSFSSNGDPMAVEIIRVKGGTILVYGNLDGMDKVLLENLGPGADRNQLLEIDVPANVIITIESYSEVNAAKFE